MERGRVTLGCAPSIPVSLSLGITSKSRRERPKSPRGRLDDYPVRLFNLQDKIDLQRIASPR
jgi:hypothetical protein